MGEGLTAAFGANGEIRELERSHFLPCNFAKSFQIVVRSALHGTSYCEISDAENTLQTGDYRFKRGIQNQTR